MNRSKMFDAMSKIDDSLIDRCLKNNKERSDAAKEKAAALPKKSARKKLIPIAVSLLIVFSISLSAVYFYKRSGDRNDGGETAEQGLKIGFDVKSEGPLSTAKIAAATERSKFSLGEDLPVSVYCVCGSEGDYKSGSAPLNVKAKLLISYSGIDPDKITETVKEIDDGTVPDYTWSGSFDNMKSEKVVFPAKVFTEKKVATSGEAKTDPEGVVVLALEVNKEYIDGTETTERDSIAMYYRIEDGEVYLKPSEETLELAGTAVKKLEESVTFDPSLVFTVLHTYNHTAKWVAPEVITLETKKDAALALIELYEGILEEYRTCDLDGYYDFVKKDYEYANEHAPYPISQTVLSDENKRIHVIQGTRRVIEALLSLDCYYDRLDEQNVQRMMNDFEEYYEIDRASALKYFESVNESTYFDQFRKERNSDSIFNIVFDY